ncbi:lazarillo protein-like [Daphnia carinata]|uniref:lazarillo protein-like n=1 Tax=Daphnia carinata TaxID=120202 RepID=UPI00257D3C51|nr:lazarillo protein-like [Daphnia carinata]
MAGDSKRWVSLLVIVGYFLTITQAQVWVRGSCPNVTVVSDFNLDQYLGKWFANRNYYDRSQAGLDCVTVEYTQNGEEIAFKKEGIEQVTRRKTVSIGSARLIQPGKLAVSYSDNPPAKSANANYLVIGTDYKSYSVVWNCSERGPMSSHTARVLTREQEPSISTIDKVYAVLRRNGLDSSRLRLVNQKNCTRR